MPSILLKLSIIVQEPAGTVNHDATPEPYTCTFVAVKFYG